MLNQAMRNIRSGDGSWCPGNGFFLLNCLLYVAGEICYDDTVYQRSMEPFIRVVKLLSGAGKMKYGRVILIVFFMLMLSMVRGARADDTVSFSWGFFLKSADGLVRSLDFAGQEPVVSGDLLRVYLQLDEGTFVYIFLYDSRQDLYLVFPPSADYYEHSFPAWRKYYIPSSREWFTLDESRGVERFFVLASNTRLQEIEAVAKKAVLGHGDELVKKQALEIIEKKTEELSTPATVSIDPVQVDYAARLGYSGLANGVFAHRTTVSGPYGMILELINR